MLLIFEMGNPTYLWGIGYLIKEVIMVLVWGGREANLVSVSVYPV